MLRFLLGWMAWDLTQSATYVGVIAALMLAPTFILSPIFGILSDRFNPRYGLMASMVVHAAISLAGGVAAMTQQYSFPVLAALALAMGAVTSGHTPMRLALVPLLVARAGLPSAIGLSAMTFNSARIVGPAAGAALISYSNVATAHFAASGLFLVSLSILLTLTGIGKREVRPSTPFIEQFFAGVAYVRQHAGIRLILTLTVVNGVLGRTLLELLPAISGQLINGSAEDLALLTAGAGLGSIFGGLIVSRQRADPPRLFHLLLIALCGGGLAVMTLWWIHTLWQLALVVSVLALTATLAGTGCQTLTQLTTDEAYRGRVLSFWTVVVMGSPAVGAFCVGVLADYWGFPLVVSLVVLLALVVLRRIYQRRHLLLS
jgi:MFS family permease